MIDSPTVTVKCRTAQNRRFFTFIFGIDMIKSFGGVSFLRTCGTLGLNIIQINAL
jgi:hypothetical protein